MSEVFQNGKATDENYKNVQIHPVKKKKKEKKEKKEKKSKKIKRNWKMN